MFALVKWAYKLGVQHERERISSYLQMESVHRSDNLAGLHEQLNSEDYTKHSRRNLERRMGIEAGIQDVIQKLWTPKFDHSAPIDYETIMFPKEGK